MAISPAHFVVVVAVRLNPQEGEVWVVGFFNQGKGRVALDSRSGVVSFN